MDVITVDGATGLYDTNYEGKAQAAIEALRTHDFVYLHIEASDEAGHDGDARLKVRTIEDLDKRIVGTIYNHVRTWDEPVAIAVLPDHPTPCAIRTHTADPVPFLICRPGLAAGAVTRYDEHSVAQGAADTLHGNEFITLFLNPE
jgi:2,3-bisphosphoglycerate-independent phosphoglycerate mutase